MIFDSLDNLQSYSGLHRMFADVCSFISKTDLADLPDGKHLVNGDGAFASVNVYETKTLDDCFIECHRKYIDVQVIAWGEERVGVAHKASCGELPYDEEKDLQKLTGKVDFITLVPGVFAIFFPHDAHEPCVRSGDGPVSVKKIVFKIPVLL